MAKLDTPGVLLAVDRELLALDDFGLGLLVVDGDEPAESLWLTMCKLLLVHPSWYMYIHRACCWLKTHANAQASCVVV